MKKLGIVVICLFTVAQLYGQNSIDWAVAFQGLSLNVTDMVEHPDGGVVAIGIKQELSYSRISPVMKHSNGETHKSRALLSNRSGSFVIRLDAKGKLLYSNVIGKDIDVLGVSIVSNGNAILLCELSYYNNYYHDREFANLFPEEDEVNDGFYFVTLNNSGQFIHQNQLSEIDSDADIDVTSFQKHPDGGFIIGGHCESAKLLTDDEASGFRGGGDFVMMCSVEGQINWSDVVSYRTNSCCSYAGEGNCVSVAPDGTIYMGGTYFVGGIFSNGLHTLAVSDLTKKNDRPEETYIVSYTVKGKINWVKTSLNSARFHRLAATDKGVYVGFKTNQTMIFERQISQTEDWNTVLGFISKKGQTKWMNVEQVLRFDQMKINNDGDLVVCGEAKRKYPDTKASQIAGMVLNDKDDTFIAQVSKNGKGISLASLTLWASSERMQLLYTATGEIYFGAEIWCGLSISLEKLNTMFPDVTCYGGSQIIGKLEP